MTVNNETAIRAIVKSHVESYASGFSDRHISEHDNDEGTINMKIHNVFIASLGADIQYYSALSRSLDSSLGNMLERMAINIATLHYDVSQHVEGIIYKEQTEYIANILEEYKRRVRRPELSDYKGIINKTKNSKVNKRHESDYYLVDKKTKMHYLIELKIGGDLDNKKARSEKEALLEQYCILVNNLGSEDKVKLYFATAYNRYGEGKPWTQGRVLQFFSEDELKIGCDFWNMVCKIDNGYDIVLDEYKKNAHLINEALNKIKRYTCQMLNLEIDWHCYLTKGNSKNLIKSVPDKSIDLLLTDPPYNIGKHSTGNIPLPGRTAMNNDVAKWDWIDFNPEEWIDEFIRVLKPRGNLFIFTSYNQLGRWYNCLDHRFDTSNFMIWHKTNPAPKIFKAGFLNSCEMIFCCWNKKHTWNFISQKEMHNFLESPICMSPERLKEPKHPAQKPVSILKKIITIASNENDIVFDPFMGVGSTGVAALELKRKFIGFEIDDSYFKAGRKRIMEYKNNASNL